MPCTIFENNKVFILSTKENIAYGGDNAINARQLWTPFTKELLQMPPSS
jgi:hypothetical protein